MNNISILNPMETGFFIYAKQFYDAYKALLLAKEKSKIDVEGSKHKVPSLIIEAPIRFCLCFSLECAFKSILQFFEYEYSEHDLIKLKKNVDSRLQLNEKFNKLSFDVEEKALKTARAIIEWGKYGRPTENQKEKADNMLGSLILSDNNSSDRKAFNVNRWCPGSEEGIMQDIDCLAEHYLTIASNYYEIFMAGLHQNYTDNRISEV